MKVFWKSLKCKTKTYKNILENTIGVVEITGGPKLISNK